MFKEESTEKLIAYIQTLPQQQQNLIVKSISAAKTGKRKGSKVPGLNSLKGIKNMGAYLDKLGSRLPENYKFNREEANER
jgi:hypothetical protein